MLTCAKNTLGQEAKRARPVNPQGTREQRVQVHLDGCVGVHQQPFSRTQKPLPPDFKPLVSGCGPPLGQGISLTQKSTGYKSRSRGVRNLEEAKPGW